MDLFRSKAGSTLRLLQYASLYFFFYVIYGIGVKYYQAPAAQGFPGISELEFLVYSTYGSALICIGVVVFGLWWKFHCSMSQLLMMVLSGICTAFVIPTTTLMYSLPISVMVAMIIMRGSVIILSRAVDAILYWQGLSPKIVPWEENVATVFAFFAIGINLFFSQKKDFDFVNSTTAMGILIVYIVSYALRIYFMNVFKFSFSLEHRVANKNYFAVEQLTAAVLIFGTSLLLVLCPSIFAQLPESPRGGFEYFYAVLVDKHPRWLEVAAAGMPFGFSAFFSSFLFLFEGRTATFAGLANRLTSLAAGTVATLAFAFFFSGKWPSSAEWLSYAFLLVSVGFLTRGELRHHKT